MAGLLVQADHTRTLYTIMTRQNILHLLLYIFTHLLEFYSVDFGFNNLGLYRLLWRCLSILQPYQLQPYHYLTSVDLLRKTNFSPNQFDICFNSLTSCKLNRSVSLCMGLHGSTVAPCPYYATKL